MRRSSGLLLSCWLLPAITLCQTVTLTSSNLPILSINTNGQAISDEPKITASMTIINNPNQARNQVTDVPNEYVGKIGIEVRGQSSQSFPMKSYTIELRDDAGNERKEALFGMSSESDWVLYAPYTDKTLMRNILAYTMSREMGRWAAHCKFVEVIVNGDYVGVYVFMEKIKRDPSRVNVTKLNTTDISGDAVTGGYIFSLDKQPNAWFSSYYTPNATNANKRQFSYVYPKQEDIVPSQMAYLKSYVDAFENALAASNFQDPFTGVRKYADLSSFIDYLIVNEISRNVDGYRLSTYFHKDRQSVNPRIFAGPVWDYDLAFRNADYCSGSYVTGWALNFNYVCPGDGAGLIPFWWDKLFNQDTTFQADLRCRWKQLSQSTISYDRLTRLIDSLAGVVQEAQQRHFKRWPILGKYVWPNPQPIATTYAQEIDLLKSWLSARLDWITNSLPNAGVCYDYPNAYTESVIVSILGNIFSNTAQLRVQSRYNQDLSVQVVDMLGRNWGSQRYSLRTGINNLALQTGHWASGIYFIRMTTTAGETYTKRWVKQ
ncbi:MAG: CotH kinase family protein [Chitinophagaceae bacterium]